MLIIGWLNVGLGCKVFSMDVGKGGLASTGNMRLKGVSARYKFRCGGELV